jgi:hypothetical protein
MVSLAVMYIRVSRSIKVGTSFLGILRFCLDNVICCKAGIIGGKFRITQLRGSAVVTYIQSSIKIGSGIQSFVRRGTHTDTHSHATHCSRMRNVGSKINELICTISTLFPEVLKSFESPAFTPTDAPRSFPF